MFKALLAGAKVGAKAAPKLLKAGAKSGAKYGKVAAKQGKVYGKKYGKEIAQELKTEARSMAGNMKNNARMLATNYVDAQRRRIYQTNRGAIYTNTGGGNRNYNPTPAYYNEPGSNEYRPLY